jgi:hypothetical protein
MSAYMHVRRVPTRPELKIDLSCLMKDPYAGADAEPVTEREPNVCQALATVMNSIEER